MTAITEPHLRAVFERFATGDKCARVEPYGSGHINDTCRAHARDSARMRILQRISHDALRRPE